MIAPNRECSANYYRFQAKCVQATIIVFKPSVFDQLLSCSIQVCSSNYYQRVQTECVRPIIAFKPSAFKQLLQCSNRACSRKYDSEKQENENRGSTHLKETTQSSTPNNILQEINYQPNIKTHMGRTSLLDVN